MGDPVPPPPPWQPKVRPWDHNTRVRCIYCGWRGRFGELIYLAINACCPVCRALLDGIAEDGTEEDGIVEDNDE